MAEVGSDIDVVVPSWRGRDLIESCLERLDGQGCSHRTVVVDNGSCDGTIELVGRRFPSVLLVELKENVGFGRAVNAGARAGDGAYIVVLNNDVEVEPGFVEAITAPFSDAGVGMVAGMTTVPDTGLVDAFGVELDVTLNAYNRLHGRRPDQAPGRLSVPSGGAAAYRRTAFEAAGGFDERIFAYGEDVDLGLRLRSAGWAVASAAGARGAHRGAATVGLDSSWQRRLAGFARGYLLRRYGVLRGPAAVRALVLESLVVGWGLLRWGTVEPLRGRVQGWRAAGGPRRSIPAGAVNLDVDWIEALRRVRRRG